MGILGDIWGVGGEMGILGDIWGVGGEMGILGVITRFTVKCR